MTIDFDLAASVGAILVLLLLSAFFSGSETALTAVSRARMHQLEKDGDGRAKRVNWLLARRERLIGSLLLGNNLVNISAATLASAVFLRLFGEAGVAYATLVMTALVLIFSEVLPKTYAISNPDRMAIAVVTPVQILVHLFAPVVAAVQALVRATLNLFGVKAEGDVLSAHEEIRGAIELHHQEGQVGGLDRQMLGGILDLREYTVSDVMVHRKSMETLDLEEPKAAFVAHALASRHTRLPVWRGDPDEIVGVLHMKDLSRAIHAAAGKADNLDITGLLRDAWFVPETTTLAEQLNAFRARREHFALVVDEYGALMGLVTLEDILEEIVGEIEDEYDTPVQGVRRLPDGSVLVDGAVTIRDLNRAMDWSLPDEEAVTVAGLVIHEAQAIPDPGQVFAFHNLRFEITKRQRNQITQLKVSEAPNEAGS